MNPTGVAEAMNDPYMRVRAEEEADKLLAALKESVQVELTDVGVLRKRMRVTVPQQVIGDFMTHNIDELLHDAVVPGFRKGRAPRKLVEKRFAGEVRDSLKTMVLGQSYFAALENNKLEVLGDPLIQITSGEDNEQQKFVQVDEAINHLKLPDEGDFSYTCEIEVRPEFELPELTGVELFRPDLKIGDEDVEKYILNQRRIKGRYEPVVDVGAGEDDLVIADVVLRSGGTEVKREDNVQLGVRPSRLDGIPLDTLGEALKGVRGEQTRRVECVIPDDYERQDLRGKSGEFELTVHEVKRLVPMAMDEFLKAGGLESESELTTWVRQSMESELGQAIQDGMKNQVAEFLLKSCQFDLPEKLSARQTDRAVMRQIIDLQRRGMPMPDIEARIDELRTVARDEAATQLKMQFILDKVAEKLEVQVTDEEVNTAIASIARRYNRRFDRIRDELQQQGTLQMLAEQIRHDKCIDRILADAKIVDKPLETTRDRKEAGPPTNRDRKGAETPTSRDRDGAGAAEKPAAKRKAAEKAEVGPEPAATAEAKPAKRKAARKPKAEPADEPAAEATSAKPADAGAGRKKTAKKTARKKSE